jgi:putative peptidoglycan lipid II flippase
VVRLVFQRGEFDAHSTDQTATALFFFSIGLAFNGASLLVIRAFFSLQKPVTPTKVALLGAMLNVVLDAAFYAPFGIAGIPFSTSITSIVTFLILVRLLSRELGGLERAAVVSGVVQSAVGAALSALFAWTVYTALDDAVGRGTVAQLVSVGAALAAAVAGFLAAALAFRMPELRRMTALARPLR